MNQLRKFPDIPQGLKAAKRPISFVCVRFSDDFEHNIIKSPCVANPMNQFIVVDNMRNVFFASLGAALSHGMEHARHELIALVHEDVLLIEGWHDQFETSLEDLERECPDWGLVGSVGWVEDEKRIAHGHWSDPGRPVPVNTFTVKNFHEVTRLDEQILVLRRSTGIRPDPDLPSIHEIGRDLAIRLGKRRLKTFAINAPTIHKYADSKGRVIQKREDSPKVLGRMTLTFQAEYDVSRAYIDHKHRLERGFIPSDPTPQLDDIQKQRLDAPIILIGLGGGGTRLLSNLAEDCGLFIGNEMNSAGECKDMMRAVYRSVHRHLQVTDSWSRTIIPVDLRNAAASMLNQAGWPEVWGINLPENGLILPEIANAFPNARYIHLLRDPQGTIFMPPHMAARLDNEIGRASVVAAYDHVGRDRKLVLQDSDLVRIAAAIRHQLDLIDVHKKRVPADGWMTLSYEQTVASPECSLRTFADFCGLEPRSVSIVDSVGQERPLTNRTEFGEQDVEKALRLLRSG